MKNLMAPNIPLALVLLALIIHRGCWLPRSVPWIAVTA
jgi:hypothetical protein